MVVSAVYMCMHIYVAAACRSVLLVKLRQSSKLMLQDLIIAAAKVQSVLLASSGIASSYHITLTHYSVY